MSNDLVKRLRELTCNCYDAEVIEAAKDAMDEAADRIEKLEAALNRVISLTDCWESSLISQVNEIAREALEGEDE